MTENHKVVAFTLYKKPKTAPIKIKLFQHSRQKTDEKPALDAGSGKCDSFHPDEWTVTNL